MHNYGQEFKDWKSSEKGKDTVKIHRDHEKYFQERLSIQMLDKMDTKQFAETYKMLWASNMWGNKDWYIENKLLAWNGLEKIRVELKKLLYDKSSVIERIDEFKINIKGFGMSSLSEILHFVFPDEYCLWNDKPKTVLPAIKLSILPEKYFKYQIHTGQEYSDCLHVLGLIKNELIKFGVKDFIDLDVMFWHIFDDLIPVSSKQAESKATTETTRDPMAIVLDTHESVEYYLLKLGEMLGYYSYTVDQIKTFNGKKLGEIATLKEIPSFAGERDLNSAREIDVIWFGDDENPKMCFEVEHTTDIVHGLNRLTQLKHLYVNFFVVASEDRRKKFQIEMNKFPYRSMRQRYRFISYDELKQFFELAIPFQEMKAKLFGGL